jgi:hypothetical protein
MRSCLVHNTRTVRCIRTDVKAINCDCFVEHRLFPASSQPDVPRLPANSRRKVAAGRDGSLRVTRSVPCFYGDVRAARLSVRDRRRPLR